MNWIVEHKSFVSLSHFSSLFMECKLNFDKYSIQMKIVSMEICVFFYDFPVLPFNGISGEQNHADKTILVLCKAIIVWWKKRLVSNKYMLCKAHLFVHTQPKPHTTILVNSIPIFETLLDAHWLKLNWMEQCRYFALVSLKI